jgi:mannose-1-phosphate guanylyltransferase
MVLCAGLGTRMRPLSAWRAKPLAPVGDRPALAHVLDAVRRASPERVVVNAHHRAGDVRAYARAERRGVAVSEETELLGTAGGVRAARELLGPGDVLVWNGDVLAGVDAAELARAHGDEATLAIRAGAPGSGNVGIAADGRVVRLRRETTAAGEVRGGEFLGIHVLGEELRGALPERGCLVGDVYLPAMRRGARVRAFFTDAPFWDIGTLEAYLDANLAWLAARGATSFVAPGAQVDPAVALEGAIVLEGARATGVGALTRVVVWEGAACVAPLASAVVAPEGIAVVERAPPGKRQRTGP